MRYGQKAGLFGGLWLLLHLSTAVAGEVTASNSSPAGKAPEVVVLWPEGKMPGSGAKDPEGEIPSSDGFHRITNISHPTLTLFLVSSRESPAPLVIVCPGGAYKYVVFDKEGTEIAAWLNSLGISAAALKYRTPENREGALQDLQRALSLVRARAAEWKVDPHRVGVIGFSAGGHLAARASTRFETRSYSVGDESDQPTCRPDFVMLVYPAYLIGDDGRTSADLTLSPRIPPTLIIHNEDDKKYVAGSKAYHASLDEWKIPHQLILYGTGGHGYGLHCTREARAWPGAAANWLRQTGLSAPSSPAP